MVSFSAFVLSLPLFPVSFASLVVSLPPFSVSFASLVVSVPLFPFSFPSFTVSSVSEDESASGVDSFEESSVISTVPVSDSPFASPSERESPR